MGNLMLNGISYSGGSGGSMDYDIIAPEYDSSETYNAWDYVIYNDKLYRCTTDNTTGTWNPVNWDECPDVASELSSIGQNADEAVDTVRFTKAMIYDSRFDDYDPTKTYEVGDICTRNDTVYRCKTAITTPHAWNVSEWQKTDVIRLLNLKADKTSVEQAIDALLPIDTASGSVANFNTSIAKNLVSCVAQITAVQSGSGDPSPLNVRSISGWNACTITRCGVNLWKYGDIEGTRRVELNINIPITSGVISGICESDDTDESTSLVLVAFTDGTLAYNTVNRNTRFSFNFAKQISTIYFHASTDYSKSEGDNFSFSEISLTPSATSYEAYTSTTLAISWQTEAGTVYGGELDLLSGVLTVNKYGVDLGSLEWTSNQGFHYSFIDGAPDIPNTETTTAICEQYKAVSGSDFSSTDKAFCLGLNHVTNVWINDSNLNTMSASDFQTAVNGIKLVYPLATPITYQLTPQEIETLIGENNIWADTGDIAVSFKCTPQDYVDSKLSALNANNRSLAKSVTEEPEEEKKEEEEVKNEK